jgi:ribosomal protein S18 acetylase RimI-like enzyme
MANAWADDNWLSQVKELTTFIASIETKDVGVARSVKDENDSKTAWIISMWVAPEARGKKVASKLLQSIVDWAKNEDVKCLKLDVVDTNTAAIKLYESYGFKPNGKTGSFPEPRTHITEHQRELKL